MDEFFLRFLQARVGSQELVASWAYNIIFSLERHRFDGEGVELFLLVLRGEITEDVRTGQQREVEQLQSYLTRALRATGEHASLSLLMNVLSKYWGEGKSESEMADLEAAIPATIKSVEMGGTSSIRRAWGIAIPGRGRRK